MKRLLLVGAFSCHLVVVVVGALHLTSRLHGPVGRGLRFYDELSGAGDSYSFFAPAVGPQLRARFTLSTPRGERSEETLEAGKESRGRLPRGESRGDDLHRGQARGPAARVPRCARSESTRRTSGSEPRAGGHRGLGDAHDGRVQARGPRTRTS